MSKYDFKNQESIASGWGLHSSPIGNGYGPYANRLQKLQGMKILDNQNCNERWAQRISEYGNVSIVDAMICAKKDSTNSSTCFGDSGGKKCTYLVFIKVYM